MSWRAWWHALTLLCGVALIVLGFADYHVEIGAIVVGLILVGALSGGELVRFFRPAWFKRPAAGGD